MRAAVRTKAPTYWIAGTRIQPTTRTTSKSRSTPPPRSLCIRRVPARLLQRRMITQRIQYQAVINGNGVHRIANVPKQDEAERTHLTLLVSVHQTE